MTKTKHKITSCPFRLASYLAKWWRAKPLVRNLCIGACLLVCLLVSKLINEQSTQYQSWSRTFTTPIAGTLVLHDTVYATDQSGGFWQIDAKSGKTKAYIHLGLATTYQPFAINEQLVGFVSNKGAVLAVTIDSMSVAWKIETDELAEPELPQVDRNFIYFADRNQVVYVADSTTGKLLWKKSFADDKKTNAFLQIEPVKHTPFYTDETSLYIGSRSNNQLTRCQLLTGECQLIRANYNPQFQTVSVGSNILTFTNTNQEYELVELPSLKTLFQVKLSASPINQTKTTIFSVGKKIIQYSFIERQMLTAIEMLNQIQSIALSDTERILGMSYPNQYSSDIFLADLMTSSTQWQTTLSGMCQSPLVFSEITVVPCQNQLYGLETNTGIIQWQLPLLGSVEQIIATRTNQATELLVIQAKTAAQTNALYGVEKTTGKIIWQSPLISVVDETLSATKHGALVVANQGHALLSLTEAIPQTYEWPVAIRTTATNELVQNKQQTSTDICPQTAPTQLTGKMRLLQIKNKIITAFSSHPITVSEIATSPAVILEIRGADITSVTARFWQDYQVMEHRTGFPVRSEVYQVRFLPPSTGTWFWEIEVKSNFQKQTIKGMSKNISVSQQNALTITNQQWQQNTTPFYGIGWQTCMLDYDLDGIWTDHWPQNNSGAVYPNGTGVTATSAATYIQSMKTAGFNLMRLSLENCSPRLTQCLTRSNLIINQQTSAAVDTVLMEAKRNQMAVVFGIFGFEPMLSGVQDGKLAPNLTKYLDYVIARYGAYVDVWELANESTPNNEWIAAVSNYIKTHDPYHHSITISWERPDLAVIDSAQLHYYDSEPLTELTRRFLPLISQTQTWHKPVMIGESGNTNVNSDPDSLVRFVYKNWVSIFTHTPIIWWDYPTQLYYHPTSANIYLGPAEKNSVMFLQTFINSYLRSATQRYFELTRADNQPLWLGIETDQHVFLFAADPFNPQSSTQYERIPTSLKISQLILPLSGKIIPIHHLNEIQKYRGNSQPYLLVFNRQL